MGRRRAGGNAQAGARHRQSPERAAARRSALPRWRCGAAGPVPGEARCGGAGRRGGPGAAAGPVPVLRAGRPGRGALWRQRAPGLPRAPSGGSSLGSGPPVRAVRRFLLSHGVGARPAGAAATRGARRSQGHRWAALGCRRAARPRCPPPPPPGGPHPLRGATPGGTFSRLSRGSHLRAPGKGPVPAPPRPPAIM